MILFTILAIIAIILIVVTVLTISVVGAGGILIFGDVIVCIVIIGFIISRIIKKRRGF